MRRQQYRTSAKASSASLCKIQRINRRLSMSLLHLNTNWWLNRQVSFHQSFKALHITNTTQKNGYRWRCIYTLSMSSNLHSSRKGFRVVESSPGQLQQQDSTPISSILKTYVEELVHELQSSLSVKEHIQLPFCVVGLQKIQISIPFVSDHLPQKTKSHRHDPILINLVQSTIPHIPLCAPFH